MLPRVPSWRQSIGESDERTHVGERSSPVWPNPVMFPIVSPPMTPCLGMAKASMMCHDTTLQPCLQDLVDCGLFLR